MAFIWINNQQGFGTSVTVNSIVTNVISNQLYFYDVSNISLFPVALDPTSDDYYYTGTNFSPASVLPNTTFIIIPASNTQIQNLASSLVGASSSEAVLVWINDQQGFGSLVVTQLVSNVITNQAYYYNATNYGLYSVNLDSNTNSYVYSGTSYAPEIILPNTTFVSLSSTSAELTAIQTSISNVASNGSIYVWIDDANGFGDNVQTQFVQNINPVNNAQSTYYFDANYNGLFSINFDSTSNSYVYSGTSFTPEKVLPNTTFQQLSATDANVSSVASVIINGRLGVITSNPASAIAFQTQDTSSFVSNDVLNAISASGISVSSALSSVAPLVIDANFNAGLQDALSSWVNGPLVIQGLGDIVNSQQSLLQSTQQSTSKIADFKKKLLKQQVALSDEYRKVQGKTSTFLSNGTFTHLASSFPSSFGKLTSMLNSNSKLLGNQISSLLPTSGLSSGTAISGIVDNFINSNLQGIFGSVIPAIINPMDKIVADISKLESTVSSFSNNGSLGSTSILNSIPLNGFNSITDMSNFANQSVNVLSNIINKIPISLNKSAPNSITNLNSINTAITTYKQLQTGKISLNSNSPGYNKSSSLLSSLMTSGGPVPKTTSVPVTGTSSSLAPVINSAISGSTAIVSVDPFQGGSFGNLPTIQNVLGGEVDQSIPTPNVTQSPDPSVAANQNTQSSAQIAADAPGTTRNNVRGSGINILDELPLRPRNIPTDGATPGDYKVIQGIPT